MRVDLEDWQRENKEYIIAWISMGLMIFGLVIWKLGLDTLILIAPFLPFLVIGLCRWGDEVS